MFTEKNLKTRDQKTVTLKDIYFSEMIFLGRIDDSSIRHPLWSHRSFSKALWNIRVIVFQKSHGIFPNSKGMTLSKDRQLQFFAFPLPGESQTTN